MKEYLIWVMAVLAMGAAMMARAASEEIDGVTWYYGTGRQWNSQTRQYEDYAYITSGTIKYAGDLTVPSQLGNYPVTSIGEYAFEFCSGLTSVTIPEGVTSIGFEAFFNCSGLTSVTIPEGVTSIGGFAFYNCSGLMSVTIPASVTSIDSYAFEYCSGLTSVTIPSSVTSIGSCAFSGCSGLTSMTIPSSVTSIEVGAFSSCSGLMSISVDVANSNYKSVNDLLLSKDGTILVSGVNGDVTIPEGVTSIGEYAFEFCSRLTSVTIPEGVTSIGSSAFSGCSGLKSVTIPSSVTSIGSYVFDCGSGLTSVTFLGAPPSGIENSYLLNGASRNISYPREYGGAWMKLINDVNKFGGYDPKQPVVAVVSSKIRVNDPTILDVVYKVTSAVTNTVKVRALAFEDGVRSFAKVVRPETFVADTNGVETAGNVGDDVAANVEHTLSWKVSSDWSNQLAKVSFEVLASVGDLLPVEVRTIPASDQYGKMDVTWNAITESQWFDALLWLYADKTDGLTLVNGVLKNGTTNLASQASVATSQAAAYVFGKMGYTVLSGEVRNYVNEETRLGLSPSGARQYGYKIVSEK